MSGPKGTLGYRSRTEAAIAMQAQGHSNRQIAEVLGVSVSTAAALLASGHRAKRRGGTGVPAPGGSGRGKYGLPTAHLETAIMDLHDAGHSRADIAAQLGIERHTVEKIVSYMGEGATDVALGRYATAKASAALLAAILRHHPDRCSA